MSVWLLMGMLTGCITIDLPENTLAVDDDGDGFTEFEGDCDDRDPNTFPGSVTEATSSECMKDSDSDGFGDSDVHWSTEFDAGTDCDDNDATTFPGAAENESDTECLTDEDDDGWSAENTDCDDSDSSSTIIPEDQDCDGVPTSNDCDDFDSLSTFVATDGDCDGVLTIDDCDDNDSNSTIVAEDQDCDGVSSVDDCDDLDPNTVNDMDCDGVLTVDDCDDFNDADAALSGDCDQDGILATNDCDDGDANLLAQSGDVDCDGVLSVDDCDDGDANLLAQSGDVDCDGVLSVDDCDDSDPFITLGVTGADVSCAATSCKTILDDGYSIGDGTYWIDLDGNGPIEVYCDMTNDGGGWTLVAALVNRYAREDAPAAFFTEDVLQNTSSWQLNTSNQAITPTQYGILKVDDWDTPSEIRYQMTNTSTGSLMNTVIFDDPFSIAHLQQYNTVRHLRTGSAVGYTTAFSTNRTYYYASDYEGIWGYDSTFGRLRDASADGWQFGLSVNLPDNQAGYNGIHDDKNRTEYNLGVAGYFWQNGSSGSADISGYWSPYCVSSCTNEDWSMSHSAGLALVQVWHKS